MRLGDLGLDGGYGDEISTLELAREFNRTRTDYPRDRTVHELFREVAEATPDAEAVLGEAGSRTYGDLDAESDRIAHLLLAEGLLPEEPVGVLGAEAFAIAASLLGILKAGGAYVPLDTTMPLERARFLLEDTGARILVGDRRSIRRMNRLQMECPRLGVLVCVDSRDARFEPEEPGAKMRRELWDHVGETMTDDITGGGWASSYTGLPLSRSVMDEYGESARAKLAPFCGPRTRVLEIGCASGITMFRLAPLVGRYVGTDLSPAILDWTRRETQMRGFQNIRLEPLPADAVDRLGEADFDLVIINSVLQCFSGVNYLRDVLRKAMALMKPRGRIFLGNVFDQERKGAFLESLAAWKRDHPADRVKLDWDEELFLDRAWVEDLECDLGGIRSVTFSPLASREESELTRYAFDAILEVDREVPPSPRPPRRRVLDRRHLELAPAGAAPPRGSATALAYIIYTSGTTGRPKGVQVEHMAIVRLVRNTDYAALDASTRILQTGALAFDASTFEIWGPLLNGGAFMRPPEMTLLDPAAMKGLVRRHGITTLWLTAGLFNQFVDADLDLFRGLDQVLTGGEAISEPHARRFLRAHPGIRLINGYGPTENTTFSTAHRVLLDEPGAIPIGRPIANSGAWILGPGDEPCGIGIPGEICVSGDGLARGYLGDPDLTARRFAANPWEPGERIYRTGDRGRWREDGAIEYLGRIDDQVKIRGYRIEPGEISSRLGEDEAVDQAVVVVRETASGKELVAYVTGAGADPDAVRSRLKRVLPEYMVPAHIVKLDAFPLNASGKVDRRALPAPVSVARVRRPLGETEAVLAGIWQEVLGVEAPGPDDDFFDLGGHSLKVTSVVARIQERLGIAIPLSIVFRATTIASLATAVQDAARSGVSLADETRVLLRETGGIPVFAFPPGTGDVLSYIPVAEALPGFAVHAFNFLESPTRCEDYAAMVEEVLEPGAPAILLGYSSGGNLAYRVAVELERRGREVRALVLVDAARKLAPIAYREDEVMAVARDFLEHPSIRPYVENVALREKLVRRIRASVQAYCRDVNDEPVKAAIRLLRAAEGAREHRDESGRIVSSQDAWAALAGGGFEAVTGSGSHERMLMDEALAANLPELARMLGG